MPNIAVTLYAGVFDQREQFPQWGLSCLVERLPMAQARWCVLNQTGIRELCTAGLAGDAGAEFATLRIEILEPAEGARHEFTWQRAVPAGFGEEERRFLLESLEHLVAAERLARRLQSLLREARGGDPDPVGFAIVDASGAIESSDRVFDDYVRGANPTWDGCSLPFSIELDAKVFKRGVPFEGLYYRLEPFGEKCHVRVRRDRRAPSVSSREMQVALKLAGGLTFKEIARDLGLAPSTVSTHAYNLYDKLGIRRRAQLVEWVHRQERRGT